MKPTLDAARALRNAGRYGEAEAAVRAGLADSPDDAEARSELFRLLMLQGRVAQPPTAAAAVDLARRLSDMTGAPALQGRDEGPRLQRAVDLILAARNEIPATSAATAAQVLWRAGEFDLATRLLDGTNPDDDAIRPGGRLSLLRQMSRVETDADRLELLRLHKVWAQSLERAAQQRPLARVPPRKDREKLRLGFLSSDLRQHVVAYFVLPLFQYIEARFDLFVYSSRPGPADGVEQWFMDQATAYRVLPADDRQAAAVIAEDDLDMLIDLGGPTGHGRPGVVAFKPAPRQVSWLGYPHSIGVSAVDGFLCDPYLKPRDEFLLERPLVMPGCWICMAPPAFPPEPPLDARLPAHRNGYITFGTANDAHKYNPTLLRTWAEILARTPDSRFMVVRPEAGAAVFQANFSRPFTEAGVAPERLIFRPLRGAVRPAYSEIDVALDTFPATGGTTTCDALWMGTPTVTLIGPAPYERLSWSILANAGLEELGAETREEYVAIACRLANDLPRLAEWRATMRERIEGRTLGQPFQFAVDFYTLMVETIRGPAT